MRFIVADWETFYDSKEYTLSKMTTESYIRDPRFEAHGCAIKRSPDLPAKWWNRHELPSLFQQTDWSDVFLIHHHAAFDGLINSHHYNIHPKMYGCTLSMARLLIGNHLSVSLESVRKHFGMPGKTTPYDLFNGKKWDELSPAVQQQVADGAIDEVESIWIIFQKLMALGFPVEELEVVDQTIKMFTEPVLRADVDLLAKIWETEAANKTARMAALDVTAADLQSSERFAQLLRDEGEEPEMKDGKNEPIYAFAKTDPYMRDYLLEHDNDRVRTLAEARLGAKSTIMQTRAETLGWMASRGPLCVYLNYAGAGTLRPSGGDGSNFLNLKRRSPIRPALQAPDGYLLAPADSSQIECRCLHYLAGGPDEPVIEKFRNGEDPYVDQASLFYGEPIYKPKQGDPRYDEMEAKRGMGKQGRLMCGYGASGKQFKITAKNGLYGPSVEISIEDATAFVKLYRDTTPSVCAPGTGYWAQASRMLARLGGGEPMQWGPLYIKDHRIYLPNGCPLIYDTLHYHVPTVEECAKLKEHEHKGYWRVKTRYGWKTMWGSKLVQNICEAVSRVIISQAMIRLSRLGYRALNWPYDELLFYIPDDGRSDYHLKIISTEMKREPDWLPGLPLDCEINVGKHYSK